MLHVASHKAHIIGYSSSEGCEITRHIGFIGLKGWNKTCQYAYAQNDEWCQPKNVVIFKNVDGQAHFISNLKILYLNPITKLKIHYLIQVDMAHLFLVFLQQITMTH